MGEPMSVPSSNPPPERPSSVLRETDAEARTLARRLVREARFVSLAVVDHENGFPAVSRALTATDLDGVPIILVSALARHARSLTADPRCSLLAGEPGKGDPLAHARITVFAQAVPVSKDGDVHARLRSRFLAKHPKAALYIDFGDFSFFRLVPTSASLNGGFGRAYALEGADLLVRSNVNAEDWLRVGERIMIKYQEASRLAEAIGAPKAAHYRLCGIDPAGIDLISGNLCFRHEFASEASSPEVAEAEVEQILDVVQTLRKI
jgi:putative heme iron utilization protein